MEKWNVIIFNWVVLQKFRNCCEAYIFVMVVAVLLVIFDIVKFVEYLIDEVAREYLTLGQSVIIFVLEAVAVVLISKAMKGFAERRIEQVEE